MTGQDRSMVESGTPQSDPLRSFLEGATGLVKADRGQLFGSVGHILQRLRSGRRYEAFTEEWDLYRRQGKISDDYVDSEQHHECLAEILAFLESDNPDERRFNLLKAIFFSAAMQDDRPDPLPFEYLRVVRSLTPGEALVLAATFELSKRDDRGPSVAVDWLNQVARKSGLTHSALVEVHEKGLMGKYLLKPRTLRDGSGVTQGPGFRLTTLGIAICDFIGDYEPDVSG